MYTGERERAVFFALWRFYCDPSRRARARARTNVRETHPGRIQTGLLLCTRKHIEVMGNVSPSVWSVCRHARGVGTRGGGGVPELPLPLQPLGFRAVARLGAEVFEAVDDDRV